MTDSLSIFVILRKTSLTTEKEQTVELKNVQNSFNKMKLHDVAYVGLKCNIADALIRVTKKHTYQCPWKFNTWHPDKTIVCATKEKRFSC